MRDMSGSSAFAQWKKQNPGEYSRWQAFDKALRAGPVAASDRPVLRTKFGQGMVDAGVIYLNAYESGEPTPPIVEPPVEPPVTPPAVTPPTSAGPFQALWDATRMPQRAWTTPVTITCQQALDGWLRSRPANGHAVVKGFTYNGRLEIRGGGPFWMECDPTFQVVNRQVGTVNFGFWLVQTTGATITGFPVAHDCGNQGLRAQAAVDCYLEIETRDNGGNGLLLDQVGGAGTKTGGTFKIRGGGSGRGAMPPGSPRLRGRVLQPRHRPARAERHRRALREHLAPRGGHDAAPRREQGAAFGAGCQTTGLQGTSASRSRSPSARSTCAAT